MEAQIFGIKLEMRNSDLEAQMQLEISQLELKMSVGDFFPPPARLLLVALDAEPLHS